MYLRFTLPPNQMCLLKQNSYPLIKVFGDYWSFCAKAKGSSTTIRTLATIKTTTTAMVNPNQTLLYRDNRFNYYKVKVAPGRFMRTGTSGLTCASYGMKAVCGGTPQCYAKTRTSTSQCVFTPLSYSDGGCFNPLSVVCPSIKSKLFKLSFRKLLRDYLCPNIELITVERTCPILKNLFIDIPYPWTEKGECGLVNNKYCSHGDQTVASGDVSWLSIQSSSFCY